MNWSGWFRKRTNLESLPYLWMHIELLPLFDRNGAECKAIGICVCEGKQEFVHCVLFARFKLAECLFGLVCLVCFVTYLFSFVLFLAYSQKPHPLDQIILTTRLIFQIRHHGFLSLNCLSCLLGCTFTAYARVSNPVTAPRSRTNGDNGILGLHFIQATSVVRVATGYSERYNMARPQK